MEDTSHFDPLRSSNVVINDDENENIGEGMNEDPICQSYSESGTFNCVPSSDAGGNDSCDDEEDEREYKSVLAMKRNLSERFETIAAADNDVGKEKKQGESAIENSSIMKKVVIATASNPKKNSRPPLMPNSKCSNNTAKQTSIEIPENSYDTSDTESISSTASAQSSLSFQSSSQELEGKKRKKKAYNNSFKPNLLKVYLRIRPTKGSSKDGISEKRSSTIEIVQKLTHAEGGEKLNNSVVRTYPPVTSQAYKSLRHFSPVVRLPIENKFGHKFEHISNNDTNNVAAANAGTTKGTGVVKGIKEYEFESVFGPEATQSTIYEAIGKPLVDGMFGGEGKSALLFAYGVTSAGKSYTVLGGKHNKSGVVNEKSGILPRSLQHIFTNIDFETQKSCDGGILSGYELKMSFIEIYNERVRDLVPVTARKNRPAVNLKVSEDGNIKGLTRHNVSSASHGLDLASRAMTNRQSAATRLNDSSSRSHCIFQLDLVSKDVGGATTSMWIVDLAGSERNKRTVDSTPTQQREASHINTSLMNLMRCLRKIESCSNSNAEHSGRVPFRDSNLTYFFMKHLVGANSSVAGRTVMIVNANPSVEDFDETQHVLSYAAVVRKVKISSAQYQRKRELITGPIVPPPSQNVVVDSVKNDDKKRKQDRSVSPQRKIARIAAKLSPRALLARKRENKKRIQKGGSAMTDDSSTITSSSSAETKQGSIHRISKNEKITRQGSIIVPTNQRNTRKFQLPRTKKLHELTEENGAIKKEMMNSREQIRGLRSEMSQLKEELITKEVQIRSEVAEEMEVTLNEMHEQYDAERRANLAMQQRTPARSVRKLKEHKHEEQIDELRDQIDECEDEIERIRESYKGEISSLESKHEDALKFKIGEYKHLKELLDKTVQEKDEQIQKFSEQLNDRDEEIALLRDELKHQISILTQKCSDTEVGRGETEYDNTTLTGNNGLRVCNEGGSTKKIHRLPRSRCSEVACTALAQCDDQSSSSASTHKKKFGGMLRGKKIERAPLSNVSISTVNIDSTKHKNRKQYDSTDKKVGEPIFPVKSAERIPETDHNTHSIAKGTF
eukprot:CAMPEP_0194369652 /NCGR_PEP_ID=MMETSP0174-20130528/17978_1 /TAXON_ID=216777 /ORGANISM="Proboscia alata, Strain PI-D3" /LENGTH=1069 /DNA_ID=CAMNT_0039146723 /DNA_START=48 /DNA_END=3257 /DNA_ORIENTATION=-